MVGVAFEAADAYVVYVVRAFHSRDNVQWDWMERRSRQLLHNAVLEMIGHVLNLGRTHAAYGGELPVLTAELDSPVLWAMRSEQLDTNTCSPCDKLHGRIVRLLSPEYMALLPPSSCLGRGRCRGIMVYADDPGDLTRHAPVQLRVDESIA
jgi:hypothetical protein